MIDVKNWETLSEPMKLKITKSIEQADLGLGISATEAIVDLRAKFLNSPASPNDSAANDPMTPQA